jgi:type VI secretion system protein
MKSSKLAIAARSAAAGDSIWSSKSRKTAGTLFDRLLLDDQDEAPERRMDSIDATVRSIKRSLGRILNTRSGGAASNPDLGIADFNDCAAQSNDMAREICASIKKCIELYEPRISAAHVEFRPDAYRPLTLHFSVEASVAAAGAAEQIRIDLLMEEGRVWKFL